GAVADCLAGDVCETDRIAPHELPRPPRMERAVDDRARSDLGWEREATPDVSLAATEHGGVDGEHEGLVARGGTPIDHVTHPRPVPPHVHLEPESARAHGSDLFDGARAEGRECVGDSGRGGGSCDREFACGICDAGEAGGCEYPRERCGA